jgi:hypothetical protein
MRFADQQSQHDRHAPVTRSAQLTMQQGMARKGPAEERRRWIRF